MGFLKNLFSTKYEIPEANLLPGWQDEEWRSWEAPYDLVRGEFAREEAFRKMVGPPRKHGYLLPVEVTLIREPTNSNDPNAVRAEVDGVTLGYLDRNFAAQASPVIDKGGCPEFVVAGLIRGGTTRKAKSYGLHIWTARRISPGPNISGDLAQFEVSWPPYPVEGTDRE